MDNYFIRYEPYSLSYIKYRIVKLNYGYAIRVKPSWKRGHIFNSSTKGKIHPSLEDAKEVLTYLYDKLKRQGYELEWENEAKKAHSKLSSIKYIKWKRRVAASLGVNEVLIDKKYGEKTKNITEEE